MGLLLALWPTARPTATAILAITYDPPFRALRKAPPSLRAGLGARETAQLVDALGALEPR